MTDIATLGYKVDSGQLSQATRELDRNTKAADRTASATDKVEKSAERLGRRLGLMIGTGLVALATGFGALMVRSVNVADRVDELSTRLDISTEQLSKWGYAAKLSGTDLEGLSRGITQFSKNAATALDKDSTLGRLFKDGLKIDVRDAQGNLKTVEQLLPEVADRFKALDNQTLETALAMKLFGRSGAELLEFLNRGSDGIQQLGDELEDLGGVISTETARKAAEAKDELDRLRAASGGVATQIASALLPSLKESAEALRSMIKEGDLAQNMVTLISTALRAGVGILDAYNEAVNRVSLALEYGAKTGGVFMDILSNGLSVGTLVQAGAQIKKISDEGDKALADLAKPREIPFEINFAGEGADPKGLFKKSTAEVALEKQSKAMATRLGKFFADPSGKGDGLGDALMKQRLDGIEAATQKELGIVSNSTRVLEAQYSARLVSMEGYYSKQRSLIEQAAKAQENGLQQQVQMLKARSVSGKEAIEVQRQLTDTEAKLAKVRADSATELIVLGIQEQDAIAKKTQAIQAYTDALSESELAQKSQFDNQVNSIGMGQREFEIQSKINDLYRDQARELKELAQQRAAGFLEQDVYEAQVQALQSSIERQVEIVRDGYSRMAEAQLSWKNGALAALDDFRAKAENVAGSTYDFFSSTFTGLADATAAYATGTKDAFGSLLDDIYRQAIRFLAQQAINQLLKAFGGGGGSQGSIMDLFGSFGSGGFFGGGRALGGDVRSDRFYRVGERNHPELATIGGQQFLIPGDRGRVEPMGRQSAPAGPIFNTTIQVTGRVDARTRTQIANDLTREQRRASRFV